MDVTRLLQWFQQRPAENPAAAMLTRSLQLLDEALRGGRAVVAFYDTQWLVFAPRGLRDAPDGPQVLAYLLCGHAPRGRGADDPSHRWVWLPVAELWGVDVARTARGGRVGGGPTAA